VPKKQRHTAKRIFERIQEEGYTGCASQIFVRIDMIELTP